MGGRVYDADIARFISADPFVDDRSNLQALNRYSYVQNNPLSYTDPSGYFLKSLVKKLGKAIKKVASAINRFQRELRRKVLRKIGEVEGLSTVISIALNFIPGCQAWCSMAFNAAMTDANGGTIMQVAKGAAIAFVSSEIGGAVTGAFDGAVSQAAASMVVGGALAKAQGGKFIDGVKGAVVGMAVAYGVSWIKSAGGGALGNDEQRGREILEDTDAYGDATLLRDGTVSVSKYDGSLLSTDEANTINDSLSSIASTKDGASMLAQISSDHPLEIVLNNEGVGFGQWSPSSSRLTMSLNTDRYFYNFASGRPARFSDARILAHKMTHAISGGMYNTPGMHGYVIRRTDRIMSGINGTVRYGNGSMAQWLR